MADEGYEEPLAVLVARWVLDQVSPGEVQALAWELQARGADGPAIRTLAGYEWTTRREVASLVDRALAEAGVRLPERREAALLVARDAARGILDGSRDPHDGAWSIYAAWEAGQHPELLYDFVMDTDDLPVFPDGHVHVEQIRTAALGLLERLARPPQ